MIWRQMRSNRPQKAGQWWSVVAVVVRVSVVVVVVREKDKSQPVSNREERQN